MSAINLRNVKRDFSQLNYRPDVCRPELIDELKNVSEAAGLAREHDAALSRDVVDPHALIDVIKRVCQVCYSDTCGKETAVGFLRFLAKIYTQYCGVDDTVKRSITKCLKSCPTKWQPELSAAISCQFVAIMDDEHDLCETEYILKTLNECCDQFPNYISNCIEKAIVFFELNIRQSYSVLVSESSPTQKISAIRCIHEGFRFFLTTHRRDLLPKSISVTLNECFTDLLDSDNLPMETLFNCCYSIVYSLMVYMPALECWNTCLDKLSARSDLIKLGFCGAILNAFSGEELRIIEPCSGKSICANLYDILMDATTRNINDTSILISSSRVLFLLSKRLCTNSEIDVEKRQLESLIDFLWLRLDHFLDSIRHSARDSMINLVKMKDEHVINYILNCLSISDINSKAFFIILTILSDKVDTGSIIKYLPNISENLLHFMNSNNSAITIFINLMLDHFKMIESKLWFDYWLLPLFKNPDKIDIKHFEQIITKAVELTPDVSKHIYDLSYRNGMSLKMYLICFNIEKKTFLANNDNGNWMSQTQFETLKTALHSNDENIRYMALHLILDSQKKTQPFTDKELELMKYFITYNIKTEKPSAKQKNLSFVKKMLLRMKESQFSVAVRNNEYLNTAVTTVYKEFQQWFSNFCFENLFYDANFSRRNFSLESLHLIQICLSPIDIIGFNESKNVISLLNCLWDTFEQNKVLAKNILTYKNQKPIKVDNVMVEDLLKKSKTLASSTSPPDSITAGYLLEVLIFINQNVSHEEYTFIILSDLMDDLIKEVELAEESLTLASAKGPMYGLIHSIRHLLNTLNWQNHSLNKNWTTFIENISTLCLKCVKLVSIVVNDSSPEGIVPMDDLCQNDCQVTSQMVLLCCWRTTKESSLLLGDIVGIIATQESEFSDTLITQICSCLTLLLSETKHRGAFEQINVAYLKVCSVMWKLPTLHTIPVKYLEDVLTEIKTGLGETFCVTRRSAGMPFIIQALICTNHDKRKIVNHTMETLISICENKNITEDLKVGVVHALNVLRTLFRCSQLGDLVGPYVSRAIDISILLFNSSSWPIRNSSTLLLSALVNRVFGVPRSSTEISWKNRMTGREFFQRYPELYETFLNEFKKFSPLDMRPSLYPTLLILARLYPSVNETTDCVFRLGAYIPYIFKCAQSPVMKTRMLAATSIAPQVTQNKLVDHLYITYGELTYRNLKENTTHGLLLQMFSLVENLPKLEKHDLNKLVTLTEGLLARHDHFMNCSYVVQEVFLRCITCLWLQLDDLNYNSVQHLYAVTLESFNTFPPNGIGQSKYFESATLFLLSVSLKAQTEFSVAVYDIMKNKIHCETAFEILSIILSEKTIECCYGLEKYKDLCSNREVIIDQLMSNRDLIELVCQLCTKIDTIIDIKYSVLSNFKPALVAYFKTYESTHNFIAKVCDLRRDTEIAQALICINKHLSNLEFLDYHVLEQITQVIESVYYVQRSDDCKKACIDIIVDNFNHFLNTSEDIKICDIGNYYYGQGHPMKPHRIRMTHNLLLNYGLYRKMEIYRPHKATAEEMTKFHSDEYIRFLRSIRPDNMNDYNKQMQRFNVGEDCPVFDGLYEFCQLSAGGSVAAAVKLNKQSADICINWGGGLHHAKKSEASGFCYVNDIVLGILELLKYHQRVLYIDIDVHHGDGVEEAFYTTDRVMTVSFHKYGEYFPGTGDLRDIGAGKGKYYAVNIPLRDGMDDDSYESIFVPIITKVMETFQPSAVVLQCGADSLTGDRLGCFNLTVKGHGKCVEFVKRYGLPFLMVGGGGYTIRNVSRCWTYETAVALGAEIANELPYNDYFEYFGPDFKLHISPSNMTNTNATEYLEKIKNRLFENLRMLPHAPGVQIQAIPEDGVRHESEDEDNVNPDERNPQSITDKRIAPDNEFSDSEDEGMAPGVGGGGRKDNRSFKTVAPARKQARLDSSRMEVDEPEFNLLKDDKEDKSVSSDDSNKKDAVKS